MINMLLLLINNDHVVHADADYDHIVDDADHDDDY